MNFNLAYLDGERKLDRDATVLHELGHVIDFARRSRPSCATSSPPSCPPTGACITRRAAATAPRRRSASPTRSPSGRCAAPSRGRRRLRRRVARLAGGLGRAARQAGDRRSRSISLASDPQLFRRVVAQLALLERRPSPCSCPAGSPSPTRARCATACPAGSRIACTDAWRVPVAPLSVTVAAHGRAVFPVLRHGQRDVALADLRGARLERVGGRGGLVAERADQPVAGDDALALGDVRRQADDLERAVQRSRRRARRSSATVTSAASPGASVKVPSLTLTPASVVAPVRGDVPGPEDCVHGRALTVDRERLLAAVLDCDAVRGAGRAPRDRPPTVRRPGRPDHPRSARSSRCPTARARRRRRPPVDLPPQRLSPSTALRPSLHSPDEPLVPRTNPERTQTERCVGFRGVTRREIRSWLMDMDGVLVHEEQRDPRRRPLPRAPARARGAVPGAHQQLDLHAARPRRAAAGERARGARRRRSGPPRWRPRAFLEDQRPGGSAFVIGEAGLTTALHDAGYTLTERDPDYVVLGETRTYCFERITLRDPPDRQRRALHRHQPRRRPGPSPGRPAAGDRARSRR